MAPTLGLPEPIKAALARQAQESGRSQHDIIVETLARALGLDTSGDPRLADPALKPARVRGLEADTLAPLPEGVTTLGLLDREDRV